MELAQVFRALQHKEQAVIELDRVDCEERFIDFVRLAWHVLEPETQFTAGWAVEAMAEHLEAITNGQVKRLLMNVPPGCTKSMLLNVLWPAWEWGPKKLGHLRYISASYEKGLPTRDLVRCRDLIHSTWYQKRWPMKLKSDQDQKTYYENEFTGWRLASSVGGALTGYRADRVCIDDPHDVRRAESDTERSAALRWQTEVLPTRLNKADESAIILIMQRLHEKDCSGLILEKMRDEWTTLILPMEYEVERHCKTPVIMRSTGAPFTDPRTEEGQLLWPERFSRPAVDSLKRALSSFGGSYAVAAQLQQRPAPRVGGMFNREDWQFVDAAPAGGLTVRGWDLAASTTTKSPYTAGVKMRLFQDKVFILDVVRFQGTSGKVETEIRGTAERDGRGVRISIPQDPGQSGKAQVAGFVKLLHGFDVHTSPESGSKEDRARPFAAQVEGKNVYLVRGDWNDALVNECAMFPAGTFKDQVDACSRTYFELIKQPPRQLGCGPRIVGGS